MKIRYVMPLKMLFLMAVAYGPTPLPLVAQTVVLKDTVQNPGEGHSVRVNNW